MAFNSDILNAVEAFNKAYGVDFSIDQFNMTARAYEDVVKKKGDGMNFIYKKMFTELYKKALGNYVDGKIYAFDSLKMFNEFENNIMAKYRGALKNIDVAVPKPYGGLDKKGIVTLMHNAIKDAPRDKITYSADRYKDGMLRIRDMMAFSNKALNDGNVEKDTIATIIGYVEALKEVNSRRSGLWRFFHPIRNNAEQRDAKNMEAIITKLTGMNYANIQYTDAYIEAKNPSYSTVESVQDTLVDEIQKIEKEASNKAPEQVKQESKPEKKTNVSMAGDRYEQLTADPDFSKEVCSDLVDVIQGCDINKDSMLSLASKYLYPQLSQTAERLCRYYDVCKSKMVDISREKAEKLLEEGITEKNMDKLLAVGISKEEANDFLKNGMTKEDTDRILSEGIFQDDFDKVMKDGAKDMFFVALGQVDAFGIKNHKDKILTAQRLADVMLKRATPVGFYMGKLTQYGKGYAVLNNSDEIQKHCERQFHNKDVIQNAISSVQKECKKIYDLDPIDTSNVFKIGYRPNRKNLRAEGKALGELQAKCKNGEIPSKAVGKVINENARRWKQENGGGIPTNDWDAKDKLLKDTYPGYDPKSMDDLIRISDEIVSKKEEVIENKDNVRESVPVIIDDVQNKPSELSERVNEVPKKDAIVINNS